MDAHSRHQRSPNGFDDYEASSASNSSSNSISAESDRKPRSTAKDNNNTQSSAPIPVSKPLPPSPKKKKRPALNLTRRRASSTSLVTSDAASSGSRTGKEKDPNGSPSKLRLLNLPSRITTNGLREKMSLQSPTSPTGLRNQVSHSPSLMELASRTKSLENHHGGSGSSASSSKGSSFFKSRSDAKQPVILSSSRSNSKQSTTEGPNLYYFGPAGPTSPAATIFPQLQKSISALDIKNVSSRESEKQSAEQDIWPMIASSVLPIFGGEGLKVAIEDLNKLVVKYVVHLNETHSLEQIMYDLDELLTTGLLSLHNNLTNLSQDRLVSRFVEVWTFYFSSVVPYFEAIFVPICTELSNHRGMVHAAEAQDFYKANAESLNLRNMCLKKFRDCALLPLYSRFKSIFSRVDVDLGSKTSITETAPKLLQAISISASVHTNDENATLSAELAQTLRKNWFRGRTGGNRQGFIGERKMS